MSAVDEIDAREAWINELYGLFDGEWFSSDVGDMRTNPGMPKLLEALARIAAVEAERLVVAERALGPSIAEGLPIPWGQVVVGGE